jgi:hypothetical protein
MNRRGKQCVLVYSQTNIMPTRANVDCSTLPANNATDWANANVDWASDVDWTSADVKCATFTAKNATGWAIADVDWVNG